MGAGTPLSTTIGANYKRRWPILIAGTVAVLAAGGLATQFWKSQPGSAAEEAAGSAKLNSAQKPSSGGAVASVNNEKVTYEMLANECVARHGKEVLEDLINRLIIQQACEAQGKRVTQQEVEAEIVKIAKRFNLAPDEWQKMLQSERNISPEQYRLSVIWPMLALRKLAATSAEDQIDDEELQREFERQYGPRAKCRMIMLDNLRRAQSVWNECKKNPNNFDKLAQEHSIDPNSKSLGGAIPPIPRHSGSETVEKVAFNLAEGEISGVIEVPIPGATRYAILRGEGQTKPVVEKLSEVQDELYNELKERKTQEAIAKVFEKIKSETRVDNRLTRTVTGPDTSTVNPASRGAPKNGIKQTNAEKPAGGTKPKTATTRTPVRN